MDSGRGGGGGRTPRGKKFRGRGRGQVGSSPVHQSPTTSSTSPASPSTTPGRGERDEEPKVTLHTTLATSSSTAPKTTVASSAAQSEPVPTPATPTAPLVTVAATADSSEKTLAMEKSETVVPKDVVDKKQQSTASASVEAESIVSPATEKKVSPPPPIVTKPTPPATRKEDLELPEPPTPPPLSKPEATKVSTESKVETALSTAQQPRSTAKTLVVTPPKEPQRSSPISVEIDPASFGAGASPSAASTSQRKHSRSGSVSPGYAYALHGPVGKPGYIGGVGFSDEEAEASISGDTERKGMLRRESAIAAMETAVKGFSKRQWILLVIFGLIDLFSAITISLQAPFYPAEAERKGATPTEYGFVFGIFEFVVFLTSPIFGKYMNQLGPKTVFSVCILITSISTICFGLLDRIEDHTLFITLCFVCRIFEALGCGGFFTATFVIIACEFPESVATTFASLETFFGLGLIVGPTVGGALYDVGGFPLPFFVVGACLLVTGLLSGLVMPKISRDRENEEKGEEGKDYGILTILKIPSVALAALSIASTSMSLGFISATLEPHIRRFALTPLQTGLVFIVNGGVYALTAPIWGYICDYIKRPIYITILGNVFIFIAFIFIGPAPFIPFDTILWVTLVGLVLQGLGFGCSLVSGFIVGLRDSMKNGFPDNMATYGVASGLWTSMISLGAWVGPSLGGILYDNVGFRQGTLLILATSFVVGSTILMHTCCLSSPKSDSELEPLLPPRPISPLLGKKKDLEESGAVKPSTSYGSTKAGEGAV